MRKIRLILNLHDAKNLRMEVGHSMLITLATTPQSNIKLLIRGLKLYLASFKQVIGLALLFSMVVFIPQFIAITQGLNLLTLARLFQFYNLLFFFVDFCAIFIFTAILWRIRCVVTNQYESILDDFKIASKKIFLILGAGVIYMLIISLIVFFLIMLPAEGFLAAKSMFSINLALVLLLAYFMTVIYIFYALFFSLPLILTENEGILSALTKSVSLVWGNWWRVFLLLIIPPLTYVISLLVIQRIFAINFTISYTEPYDYKALMILMLNVIFFAFFVPFEGALLLLQLRDLELRKQV